MNQSSIDSMRQKVEALAAMPAGTLQQEPGMQMFFKEFKTALNQGHIRSAEKKDGVWQVNHWVKQGILLGFKLGNLKAGEVAVFGANYAFSFIDKDTYPTRDFSLEDKVRIVPGGTAVRDGAYVAPGVVMMPPAYINVGAYVDAGTMVDSHALVGSCAQIGKNVHLSAASQIGGVLEPIGAMPVIIEDEVMIGGNCGIYEGTIVEEKAVIGTGVILNASTPVYDVVNEKIIRKTETAPLTIPKGAVVVAGSRPIKKGGFAEENGLSIYTPIIIKYRDDKTDGSVSLEDLLR
ncbi:2,3,4,5-tetrahydropyridine-2,6-dicarboxylate N-succinyltransferase [Chloroherpeton thalassium ATCC 35110]|uniref:2,3,4,5-tetrahydropyridine-2,6-dicarboxylate N-succinyltransferase n=1 Tax=Chloroherpeton thalassium (strain ATCC 35110 / GB-78) TaxID=517418 RepID=B3QZC3_CHLT3|nr:2,3,4,5-tetrahydropyridine-2,6-dicarboxylate N-succinyltransferase [Chloroherpeton thalassium]ACF13816.1 2,3,4,5-tetrahydropyridine-2,6-dicarboxylate N-succinyltransferase [Chloroherpeton thalassium ATCC 35110]